MAKIGAKLLLEMQARTRARLQPFPLLIAPQPPRQRVPRVDYPSAAPYLLMQSVYTGKDRIRATKHRAVAHRRKSRGPLPPHQRVLIS